MQLKKLNNMKQLIETKIKQLYNNKAAFAKHIEVDQKNLSHKLRGVQNKIDSVNEFLSGLGLRVSVVEEIKGNTIAHLLQAIGFLSEKIGIISQLPDPDDNPGLAEDAIIELKDSIDGLKSVIESK